MVAPFRKALLLAGHFCARFSHWKASVRCILAADSFGRLDDGSRARLLYALMMCGPDSFSIATLEKLIRNESNKSMALDCWLASAAQRLCNRPEAIRLYTQAAEKYGSHQEAAQASQMALLLGEISAGDVASGLAVKLDALSLARDRDVILVCLGSHHLPLFGEWLKQAREHASGQIIAVALDSNASIELRAQLSGRVIDLSRYFSFDRSGKLLPFSKHALWIVRTLLIRNLVVRDNRVLSIDLDAFMLGDVDRMLDSFPSADIVVQQDFSIPMDVARPLGFVLCCGFIYFRPTEATKSLLDRFADRVVTEMDDQVAINHMIYRAGISAVARSADSLSFESLGARWVCPARELVSREISYGAVVRHFKQQGETVEEIRIKLGLT